MKRKHYVGVFDERNDAELAARDLREKGFKDDQIGYAWRDDKGKTHQEGNKSAEMAASGAGTGVVLGGIIGAGAALLIPGIGPVVSGGLLATALAGAATGAVAGGVAGGITGALMGLGIPEDEAKYYNDQFSRGPHPDDGARRRPLQRRERHRSQAPWLRLRDPRRPPGEGRPLRARDHDQEDLLAPSRNRLRWQDSVQRMAGSCRQSTQRPSATRVPPMDAWVDLAARSSV